MNVPIWTARPTSFYSGPARHKNNRSYDFACTPMVFYLAILFFFLLRILVVRAHIT